MTGYGLRPGHLLILGLAIILAFYLVSPATASFLQNGFFLQTYSFDIDSAPVLCNLASTNLTVSQLDNGNNIMTAEGTNITINLVETDPYQNWELANAAGADYTGNSLIIAYPLYHQFTLTARSSCVVLFLLVDDRNENVVKELTFNLIVDPPISGMGWPNFSPDLEPSFGWPVESKFSPGDTGSLPLLSYEGIVL